MNEELLDIVDSLERCYNSWREQVVGILDEDDTDIIKDTTYDNSKNWNRIRRRNGQENTNVLWHLSPNGVYDFIR